MCLFEKRPSAPTKHEVFLLAPRRVKQKQACPFGQLPLSSLVLSADKACPKGKLRSAAERLDRFLERSGLQRNPADHYFFGGRGYRRKETQRIPGDFGGIRESVNLTHANQAVCGKPATNKIKETYPCETLTNARELRGKTTIKPNRFRLVCPQI